MSISVKQKRRDKMKTVFCNEKQPGTTKIAYVTGNKLTQIKRQVFNGELQYVCKLNGVLMTLVEARQKMLDGVRLVTFGDNPCIV